MDTFIKVTKLANLFGSDGSKIKPNRLPPDYIFNTVESTQPILVTEKLGGTCTLKGDYNLGIYNGSYYILKKLRTYDLDDDIHLYQLIYSRGLNLLRETFQVKGTLSVTSDEKILEANLQQTYPALQEPARLINIPFKVATDYKGEEELEIKFPDVTFKQTVLDIDELQNLLAFKDRKIYSYLKNRDGGNVHHDLYILGGIRKSKTYSGKNKLIEKIKKDGSDLKNKKVTKVTIESYPYMKNYYALSYLNEDSIGSSVESVTPINVDLSGLTDIIPLSNIQETRERPRHVVGQSSLFKTHIPTDLKAQNPIKFRRRSYLPVTNSTQDQPYLLERSSGLSHYVKKNYNIRDYVGDNSQKLTFTDGGVAYQGGTQRLDFTMVYRYGTPGIYKDRQLPTNSDQFNVVGSGLETDGLGDKVPPLGYLLFQPIRNPSSGTYSKYTGSTHVDTIEYLAGFNANLIELYPSDYSGGNKDRGKTITKHTSVSKLNIDLDVFNGIFFSPVYYDNYGYLYDDYYGITPFVGGYRYGSEIAAVDYKNPLTNQQTKNPFHGKLIREYLVTRYNKLNAVILKQDYKLPHKLKNGHYLFSSLEHTPVGEDLHDGVFGDGWKYHVDNLKRYRTGMHTHVGLYSGGATFNEIDHANLERAYLGDVMESRERAEDYLRQYEGSIVIYTDESSFKIGALHIYNTNHSLSNSPSQILSKVNDETQKHVSYYHIEYLRDFYENLTTENTLDLAKAYYAASDVPSSEYGDIIEGFSEEELETSVALFKLEGTDGYCFLANGKTHLITKNELNFDALTRSLSTLDVPENYNFSLIEKINQKNELLIYGTPFKLATKFHFTKDERFLIQITQYLQSNKFTAVDKIYVRCNEQHDHIDTGIDVPKEASTTIEGTNPVQLDLLKMQIRDTRMRQRIADVENDKAYAMKTRQIGRAKTVENENWYNQLINTVSNVAGVGMATGGHHLGPDMHSYVPYGGRDYTYENPSGKPVTRRVLPRPGIIGRKGITAINMAAGVARGVHYFANVHKRVMKEIDEDMKTAYEDNIGSQYKLDVQKVQEQEHHYFNLNTVQNVVIKPDVSDRDVGNDYKTQHKLTDYVIQTLIPSPKQVELLRAYYVNYGVNCNIPDQILDIYDGMPPTICQFSYLKIDEVTSEQVNDPDEFTFINTLFTEIGLQIIEANYEVAPVLQIDTTPSKPAFDVNLVIQQPINTLNEITGSVLQRELPLEEIKKKLIENNYGLTEDELKVHKKALDKLASQDKGDVIMHNLSSIIKARGTEIPITVIVEDTIDDIKEKCKLQVSDAEQRAANYLSKVKELEAEISKLDDEKVKIGANLLAERKKIKKLEEQLAACDTSHDTTKTKKQKTEDRANELSIKVKKYEEDLKNLEVEKTQIAKKLFDERRNLKYANAEVAMFRKAEQDSMEIMKDIEATPANEEKGITLVDKVQALFNKGTDCRDKPSGTFVGDEDKLAIWFRDGLPKGVNLKDPMSIAEKAHEIQNEGRELMTDETLSENDRNEKDRYIKHAFYQTIGFIANKVNLNITTSIESLKYHLEKIEETYPYETKEIKSTISNLEFGFIYMAESFEHYRTMNEFFFHKVKDLTDSKPLNDNVELRLPLVSHCIREGLMKAISTKFRKSYQDMIGTIYNEAVKKYPRTESQGEASVSYASIMEQLFKPKPPAGGGESLALDHSHNPLGASITYGSYAILGGLLAIAALGEGIAQSINNATIADYEQQLENYLSEDGKVGLREEIKKLEKIGEGFTSPGDGIANTSLRAIKPAIDQALDNCKYLNVKVTTLPGVFKDIKGVEQSEYDRVKADLEHERTQHRNLIEKKEDLEGQIITLQRTLAEAKKIVDEVAPGKGKFDDSLTEGEKSLEKKTQELTKAKQNVRDADVKLREAATDAHRKDDRIRELNNIVAGCGTTSEVVDLSKPSETITQIQLEEIKAGHDFQSEFYKKRHDVDEMPADQLKTPTEFRNYLLEEAQEQYKFDNDSDEGGSFREDIKTIIYKYRKNKSTVDAFVDKFEDKSKLREWLLPIIEAQYTLTEAYVKIKTELKGGNKPDVVLPTDANKLKTQGKNTNNTEIENDLLKIITELNNEHNKVLSSLNDINIELLTKGITAIGIDDILAKVKTYIQKGATPVTEEIYGYTTTDMEMFGYKILNFALNGVIYVLTYGMTQEDPGYQEGSFEASSPIYFISEREADNLADTFLKKDRHFSSASGGYYGFGVHEYNNKKQELATNLGNFGGDMLKNRLFVRVTEFLPTAKLLNKN